MTRRRRELTEGPAKIPPGDEAELSGDIVPGPRELLAQMSHLPKMIEIRDTS